VVNSRVTADPSQPADIVMRQALALEVDRLHLELDSRMGVMESFVVRSVDVLDLEVDVDHHGGPDQVGWGVIIGQDHKDRKCPRQSSNFGREQYIAR
jgi:hypothetical protein